MGVPLAGLVCTLIFATAATGAVRFDGFSATDDLSLVGSAAVAGTAVRLTPAEHHQSGAVWAREKQRVRSGFETTFQFQLTGEGGLGHGADGLAFVLQNSGPDALGGRGSAGGFAVSDSNYHQRANAIPWSIAVFFDTFKNDNEHDPSSNYVALCTYGRPADMRWPAPRLAFTPKLHVHLKDRRVHTARIVFQPPLLSVYLDKAPHPVLQTAADLSIVMDEQGSAWVGFTASTGRGYENHDILSWSFARSAISSDVSTVDSDISFPIAACLPNRNLCTPERAIVEHNGSGYHIVLPGNVEWGASIPAVASESVRLVNAHGIVCWDVAARGAEGCGGPRGGDKPAGAGFLAEGSPAGALIMRSRDGRIWFSVNDRPGAAFADNEGFYEFDLEIKPPR